MIGIEREYIRLQLVADQLNEHRFRSSMLWPKACRFYALAADPEALERCKREALKTPEERAAEKAAADARHEKYRVKQVDMPVLVVEEPTPAPAPVRRFAVPAARRRP